MGQEVRPVRQSTDARPSTWPSSTIAISRGRSPGPRHPRAHAPSRWGSWRGRCTPAELVEPRPWPESTQATDSLGRLAADAADDFDRADLAEPGHRTGDQLLRVLSPAQARAGARRWRAGSAPSCSTAASWPRASRPLAGQRPTAPPPARSSSTSRPGASPRPTSTTCASTPCSTPSRSAPRPGWWPATTSTRAATHPEPVGVAQLEAAVARTVDGVDPHRRARRGGPPAGSGRPRPAWSSGRVRPVGGVLPWPAAPRAPPTCATTAKIDDEDPLDWA